MKLLHGTFLFLSMCSLCYSQGSQVPTNITTTTMYFSSAISTSSSPSNVKNETVQTTVDTPGKLNTSVVTESVTTSPVRSLTSKSMPFTNTEKESPQTESPTEVSSTAKPQGSDHRFQSTASTTESSQKSNHILTLSTKKSENTLGMTTTPYIKDQGSSKGVILPVVIALIAITLSVFTLVGLYRMCWKTDPGTPDNGTDQPQSDKESVKLLTVKTISPETSEQSAQGKNKN
uniref:Endomucin n=1 Tax=Vombatus ursinus TaxID=29139 RepID=A0A4X2LQE3_VOMUR